MAVPIFFQFGTMHPSKEDTGNLCTLDALVPQIYANVGAFFAPYFILNDEHFRSRILSACQGYETPTLRMESPDVGVLQYPVSHGRFLDNIGEIYSIKSSQIQRIMAEAIGKYRDPVQIILGGDHSVASPGLAALLKRVDPKDVGVIMIDSHGDIHNIETSPSGNFHGMWLRQHVDPKGIGVSSFDKYTQEKLPLENLLYVGNLNLEPAEAEYIRDNRIKVVSKLDIMQNQAAALKVVTDFINRYKHVHISMDIDAIHRRDAPGTGLPADDGLELDQVFPILDYARILHEQGKISISSDLTEIYPEKDTNGKTVRSGRELLCTLLNAPRLW